jgi:hypothetical protein
LTFAGQGGIRGHQSSHSYLTHFSKESIGAQLRACLRPS